MSPRSWPQIDSSTWRSEVERDIPESRGSKEVHAHEIAACAAWHRNQREKERE